MDSDRLMIIEDLKSLQLDYNFDKYTTDQLRAIRTKSIAEREKVCRELINISKEIGYKRIPTYEELFKSKIHIKTLKENLHLLKSEKKQVELFDLFLETSFGIKKDSSDETKTIDPEISKIIQDIKNLHFNYNFEKYTKNQLIAIRGRLIRQRDKICKDIMELGKELGYGNKYDADKLYYSNLPIDKLKGILKRLYEKKKRLIISEQLLDLAFGLGYDTKEFIIQNMDQGPKSTEDLKYTKKMLEEELHRMLEESDNKIQKDINYDASFAIGDDPILDKEVELVIPYDKAIEMITIIEKLRKTGKSPYLKKLSREEYKRMMKNYLDLDKKKYEKLEEIDFIFLINIYNNTIRSIEKYEEIEEREFRHKI